MITIDKLYHSFGTTEVLRGVSMQIQSGSITGLVGPSGAGKSVLLKIIGQVLHPTSGSVRFARYSGADVSLMFQEGALFDSLDVFNNVAFPLVGGRVPVFTLPPSERAEVQTKVENILARVGLSKAIQKFPAQLSGGMRRRVSLARALVARPRYVLLDDPTCGLDPVASSVIMELIVELQHEYRPTMLIVSQDLRRLLPIVENIIALFAGKVIFDGTLEQLRHSPSEELKHFIACRFNLDEHFAAQAYE